MYSIEKMKRKRLQYYSIYRILHSWHCCFFLNIKSHTCFYLILAINIWIVVAPPPHKDFQQMALIQWLPTDGTNTVTSNRWHKNLWLPTDGTNTVTSNRWHKNLWHPLKSCMYVHNAFFHPFLAFLTKHINILQHDWGGIHPRTCLRGHWN